MPFETILQRNGGWGDPYAPLTPDTLPGALAHLLLAEASPWLLVVTGRPDTILRQGMAHEGQRDPLRWGRAICPLAAGGLVVDDA